VTVEIPDAGEEMREPADAAVDATTQPETTEPADGFGDEFDISLDLAPFDLAGETEDTSIEPDPGGAGWPCVADSDCLEEFCIQTPDGMQCTITCEEECPYDWKCVQHTPSLPDQVYICAPSFVSLCRPCLTNTDCWVNGIDAGEKCVVLGPQGSYCGGSCQDNDECPGGYGCQDVLDVTGAEAKQCVSATQHCECTQWFADQGATTECWNENEWGLCSGTRGCAASGLTECSADTPAEEICNGLDDDCDEDIDEDLSGGECMVVSPYGTCPGTEFCVGGEPVCEGEKAKAELCDGEDNDCDGLIDENFPDTDGDGEADCLETDIDGDGIADGLDNCPSDFNPQQQDFDLDTLGDICDPDDDNDLTADGKDCAPQDAAIHPEAEEICDGKDNNCNYIVDEGFIDSDTDGWKDCIDEDDDNDGVADAMDCAPLDPEVYPGATEVCDGEDNDCDFDSDEGFGDLDGDGEPDCIDDDIDGDGVSNGLDNCPKFDNAGQADLDKDGTGDTCDPDLDGDSIPNGVDNCVNIKNTLQSDVDGDGKGDLCDEDIDGDGTDNDSDNCLLVPNAAQADSDEDGIGDLCEEDLDGDGEPDDVDCAPLNPAVNHAALEVCNGQDDDCDDAVDEQLGTSACGLGECEHTEDKCQDGVLQMCNPFVGAEAEECDGLDNDCDGIIDEDLGTTPCGKGQCWHTVQNCAGGKLQKCDPLEGAKPETCDGVDNDCDGQVDEGLPNLSCGKGACYHTTASCIGGVAMECDAFWGASPEVCDGVDNDCDGAADEDLGTTTCGFGECKHTVYNCKEGGMQVCNPFDGASPEVCDTEDNDCDGLVDEDLGASMCGIGQCQHSVPNCVDGQAPACDPEEGAAPESCDGLDNDCDGGVDEELGSTTCGLGQCEHTIPACVNGVPQVCNPLEGAQAESCDGVDNDCDGLMDEELGTSACGAGECEHTVNNCKEGVPQVCNPLEGSQPEICDGKDNDCDGVTDPENTQDCTTFYEDLDSDGYGSSESKCLCESDGHYDTETGGDCDDLDNQVYPAPHAVCGKDGDCDGDLLDAGEECDDGNDQNGDGCDAACDLEPPQVFSEVVANGQDDYPKTLGTIAGYPGLSIHITKLGICGDSDSGSGPNQFQVNGAGLNFTWEAGQSVHGSTHVLPHTNPSGSGNGFTYAAVNYVASPGQSATVTWTYHYDWDGSGQCDATDSEGNAYNDPNTSVRAWVLYTYKAAQ